ncbi:hypothetical protein KQI52_14915 [bacterium]|nr:hypothetical protein [bacterium]
MKSVSLRIHLPRTFMSGFIRPTTRTARINRAYELAIAATLALTLLLVAALPASPSTLTVDPSASTLLAFDNIDEYAALTGRDPARVIGLWVARADSFQALGRSNTDLRATLAGGAWGIRGGVTGGSAYGRQYDGVTDFDQLGAAASDSTEMRDGVLYEILFRSTSSASSLMLTTGLTHGFFLYNGLFRVRINATYVVTDGSTGEYSDGQWHLARAFITADSVKAVVDGNPPENVAHSLTLSDPAYATTFGAHPNGTFPFSGAIESIAVIDYSGFDPYQVDLDGYWDALSPHLDNTASFAGPQAALDFVGATLAGDEPDTVRFLPGVYTQPLTVWSDDVVLLGHDRPHRVVIDGSPLATGKAVLTLDGAEGSQLRTFTIAHGPTALRSKNGSSGIVRNVVICDNNLAVESSSNAATDTLHLIHCTLDGNKYGLYAKSPDYGRVRIANSCLTWTSELAVVGSPPAGIITVGSLLAWANTGTVSGDVLVAPPMYLNREAFEFSLQGASPAINAGNPAYGYDSDGSPPDLGAYSGAWNTTGGNVSAPAWSRPAWSRTRWSR